MAKLTDFTRPDCSNCGMAMIAISGFKPLSQELKTFECLRCGSIYPPPAAVPAARANDTPYRAAVKLSGQS